MLASDKWHKLGQLGPEAGRRVSLTLTFQVRAGFLLTFLTTGITRKQLTVAGVSKSFCGAFRGHMPCSPYTEIFWSCEKAHKIQLISITSHAVYIWYLDEIKLVPKTVLICVSWYPKLGFLFVFSGDCLPCLWVETGYCLPLNELWAPSKSNQNHHYRYFITTSLTEFDNSAQNTSGHLKRFLCYFALICQFK